jgi:fructose-1,6-bisphosphatase I
MFMISTGKERGVHGFTYDPTCGEFFLSHENIRIPQRGKTYSINEGNAAHWTDEVKRWNAGSRRRTRPTGDRTDNATSVRSSPTPTARC